MNIIVNRELLPKLVSDFSKCKCCDSDDCVYMKIHESYQNGLAHRLVIACKNCDKFQTSMTSNTVTNSSEINTRFVYALRSDVV